MRVKILQDRHIVGFGLLIPGETVDIMPKELAQQLVDQGIVEKTKEAADVKMEADPEVVAMPEPEPEPEKRHVSHTPKPKPHRHSY